MKFVFTLWWLFYINFALHYITTQCHNNLISFKWLEKNAFMWLLSILVGGLLALFNILHSNDMIQAEQFLLFFYWCRFRHSYNHYASSIYDISARVSHW